MTADLPPVAHVVWYAQPAEAWSAALPVGNGRLGAMIFGGAAVERIQLNEQTIWTGGPYDPTQPGGPAALPEIRRLVFAGKYFEAEALFAKSMMGKPAEQMKYQPLGNLVLEFPCHTNVTHYRRELDLDTAIAGVSYRVGSATFRREVFASAVDQVIVVRLTADQPGALAFAAKLDGVTNTKTPGDETHTSVVMPDGDLVLRGKTASWKGIEGRVRYEGRVRIRRESDTAATLLIAASTNFKRYDDLTGVPEERARAALERAAGKSYAELRAAHVAEHQRLFRRVQLDLGGPRSVVAAPTDATERVPPSARPTDERLRNYSPEKDPQLMALMFQYGRYLLLGSSRPGGQPANLQGIWNEDMDPAWEGKFTANINLQMNYWPAEVTALPECVEPLVTMVKELAETGGKVARVHYGARGWVFHQNTDQWRHAAPMDGPTWGTFSVGGAWLCMHLWEHFLFTQDEAFLREVYPLLKGSAQFFLDTLVEEPTHRWLVTCPATSPENFPAWPGNQRYHDSFTGIELPGTTICAGSTMDLQILRDLFAACVEAGHTLKTDEAFCAQVQRARERLAPLQVGKQGNLQEWLEDWSDLEPKHRHISNLYGLFPSSQITPAATPALAAAAKVSLEQRGEISLNRLGVAGTGFGMAWRAACWARLQDGERANLCLTALVAHQTCPNLFSKCYVAPQVDGAFGATAAIAEMLLQSSEEVSSGEGRGTRGEEEVASGEGRVARAGEEVASAEGRVANATTNANFSTPDTRPLTLAPRVSPLAPRHSSLDTPASYLLHLLPALPSAWPNGSVTGLRARGGFTVDIEWQNGKVTTYRIVSAEPSAVKIRVNGESTTVMTEKR